MEELQKLLDELKEKLETLEAKSIVDDDANTFSDGFQEGFEYGINYVVEKIEKIINENDC